MTRKKILDTEEKVDSNDEYSSFDKIKLEHIRQQAVRNQDFDKHLATAMDLEEDANHKREEPPSTSI